VEPATPPQPTVSAVAVIKAAITLPRKAFRFMDFCLLRAEAEHWKQVEAGVLPEK
jgi:hypothetical protein